MFDDVDDSYWEFNKLLREIVDEHVPIKGRRTRTHEAPFLLKYRVQENAKKEGHMLACIPESEKQY